MTATETLEASGALAERAMRLSYQMPCEDMEEALELIFRADSNGGRLTAEQYDRLAAIVARASERRKEGVK